VKISWNLLLLANHID